MTDVREATDELLSERPELESDLREVLAVDDTADGWDFEDVPLDSGTFGELVSRDIVVKSGDEYEIAERRAVQASLDGDAEEDEVGLSVPSVCLPSLNDISESRETLGALGAALAFVVLTRSYFAAHVFRPDGILLSSNDPYYYRYWVERLASNAVGVFDLSVLSGLPGAVAKGEPLMIATMWWVTNLLGGADSAGAVLAVYPVVSAVVVSLLVYAMGIRLTGDQRVGLASVLLLAVIPAFAYRTALGFADHHAFDYVWLALTAFALVKLSDVNRTNLRRPWVVKTAFVLGLAVAAQVLAWEAGPLLLGALALYVAVKSIADVRADRAPLVANVPIAAGLGVASLLTHLAHIGFGWHTSVVTYSPALLLVGVLAVIAIAEAVHRVDVPAKALGGVETVGVLGSYVALGALLPTYAARLNRRLGFLLFKGGPAETKSMFAGGVKGFFLSPILELGFAWFLALPVLVMASWRAYHRDRTGWLVVSVYGWYFLLLASFQRRFVGELAPFFALLAGWGLVAFAAKLDILAAPPFVRGDQRAMADGGPSFELPGRKTVISLGVLLLLVTSAGAGQTAVRHEQVKIAGDKYAAAQWMGDYADEREWEYPQNYVLSKWGRNRMYNYFVNGHSRSYRFAEEAYQPFLASKNPEKQYQKLRDRVGFVVTKDLNLRNQAPKRSIYARLHKRFGSTGATGVSGVSHYRAVYASDDGSVKAFTLVPGATIVGTASPGESVTISKTVTLDGQQFVYSRTVRANPYGVYEVTVPYSGEYTVRGANEAVPESAPTEGRLVKWHDRPGIAHWPFDEVQNRQAFDQIGGHRGTIKGNVSSTNGVSIQALSFESGERSYVETDVTAPQQFTVSLWIRPRALNTTDSNDYRHLLETKNGALLTLEQYGQISFHIPGVEHDYYAGGNVPVGNWSMVTATYNGSHQTLYVDGERIGTNRVQDGRVDWGGELRIGNGFPSGKQHGFDGAIDEVQIYDHALTAEEVRQRYTAVNETDS